MSVTNSDRYSLHPGSSLNPKTSNSHWIRSTRLCSPRGASASCSLGTKPANYFDMFAIYNSVQLWICLYPPCICMCINSCLIINSDREHAVGILLYSQSCTNRQGETQRKTKGCQGKLWGVDLLQPTWLGDLSLLVDKRHSTTQTGKNCIRAWNNKLTFVD